MPISSRNVNLASADARPVASAQGLRTYFLDPTGGRSHRAATPRRATSCRMPQLHKTSSSSQGCHGTERGVEQERVAEPWRLSIVYVIALKVFNEVSTGGQMKTSSHGSSSRLTKQDQAAAMLRMYVHQVSLANRPPLSAVRLVGNARTCAGSEAQVLLWAPMQVRLACCAG